MNTNDRGDLKLYSYFGAGVGRSDNGGVNIYGFFYGSNYIKLVGSLIDESLE